MYNEELETQYCIMTDDQKNEAGSYIPAYDTLIEEAPVLAMKCKWNKSRDLFSRLGKDNPRYEGFAFKGLYMMKMSCGHYEIFQHSVRTEEELVEWIRLMRTPKHYKECSRCHCGGKWVWVFLIRGLGILMMIIMIVVKPAPITLNVLGISVSLKMTLQYNESLFCWFIIFILSYFFFYFPWLFFYYSCYLFLFLFSNHQYSTSVTLFFSILFSFQGLLVEQYWFKSPTFPIFPLVFVQFYTLILEQPLFMFVYLRNHTLIFSNTTIRKYFNKIFFSKKNNFPKKNINNRI